MYLKVVATALQSKLAYRLEVWTAIFAELLEMFAKVAIWKALYADTSDVGQVGLQDMVTYAVLATTVTNSWDWHQYVLDLGREISSGDFVVTLLRPISYLRFLLATQAGFAILRFFTVVLPVFVVAVLVYHVGRTSSPAALGVTVAFLVVGGAMLFLLATIAGVLAFWLMTPYSLEWSLAGCISLFSGTLVPLWFFPPPLDALLKFLPFSFVAYHPMAIYLGKVGPGETALLFVVGICWIAVLFVALRVLWRRASQRLVVQGG